MRTTDTDYVAYCWQDLLGPELTERLIAEAHADIPAVRAELERIAKSYPDRKAKAKGAGT